MFCVNYTIWHFKQLLRPCFLSSKVYWEILYSKFNLENWLTIWNGLLWTHAYIFFISLLAWYFACSCAFSLLLIYDQIFYKIKALNITWFMYDYACKRFLAGFSLKILAVEWTKLLILELYMNVYQMLWFTLICNL